MNFRKVENRESSLRRWRRLPGILNSRSRESFLSRHGATDAGSFPLIKYSIQVYKTPRRRMNLIMSSWTNICRREKPSASRRKLTRRSHNSHCFYWKPRVELEPRETLALSKLGWSWTVYNTVLFCLKRKKLSKKIRIYVITIFMYIKCVIHSFHREKLVLNFHIRIKKLFIESYLNTTFADEKSELSTSPCFFYEALLSRSLVKFPPFSNPQVVISRGRVKKQGHYVSWRFAPGYNILPRVCRHELNVTGANNSLRNNESLCIYQLYESPVSLPPPCHQNLLTWKLSCHASSGPPACNLAAIIVSHSDVDEYTRSL